MSTTTWTVAGHDLRPLRPRRDRRRSPPSPASPTSPSTSQSGLVTVTAETDPRPTRVAAAVDEAGYTLVTA